MKKKNYLILLGLLIPFVSNAQQVVATSGGDMKNNSVQANWTIGEPIIETTTSKNSAFTSGVNQLTIKIETVVENIKSKMSINIFPNPTSQFVNIMYDGQLPLKAKIFSLNGTIISNKELNEPSTQIDFSKLTNGTYLIEITDKSNQSNTYRIVKQ